MRFSGILLDLDNTVYPYHTAHTSALKAVLEYLSNELERPVEDIHSAYKAARSVIHRRLAGFAASHSRLLYFQTLCESFKVPPGKIVLDAEDLYWQTFFDHMVIRPLCLEFLLSVRPTPILVVTDLTARLQLEKIIRLNLQKYVDGMVSSEEAGYEKPHPQIFKLAAEKLAADPSKLCMIGDNWDKDIVGALQLNMHCYWFREDSASSEPADRDQLSANLPLERVREFFHFSELIQQAEPIV